MTNAQFDHCGGQNQSGHSRASLLEVFVWLLAVAPATGSGGLSIGRLLPVLCSWAWRCCSFLEVGDGFGFGFTASAALTALRSKADAIRIAIKVDKIVRGFISTLS